MLQLKMPILTENLIVNNTEKIETALPQMEQWSILSDIVSYIQYNRHLKNFHNLNIRAVSKERYKRKSSKKIREETHMFELHFGDTPEKLKEEYLDVYEGIQL